MPLDELDFRTDKFGTFHVLNKVNIAFVKEFVIVSFRNVNHEFEISVSETISKLNHGCHLLSAVGRLVLPLALLKISKG